MNLVCMIRAGMPYVGIQEGLRKIKIESFLSFLSEEMVKC